MCMFMLVWSGANNFALFRLYRAANTLARTYWGRDMRVDEVNGLYDALVNATTMVIMEGVHCDWIIKVLLT